jgi:aminoglycoside phosphotransferase (APT) family kinase protein
MTAELPGLPAEPLNRWLQSAMPELLDGKPWRAELLVGGLSNLTYRLAFAGRSAILRRPPLGPILPRAHDVAREYRVLIALAPTAARVPVPLAFCEDLNVIGAPFYIMSYVEGQVLRANADTDELSPQTRRAIGTALIDTLATLHAVELQSVGLETYGRHGGYCQRQVKTWGQQWDRSKTRDLPDMDRLLNALTSTLPSEDSGVSIVHGDYRLDNTVMQIDPSVGVAGVLDWELSTLGDPLADLGMLLTYWHDIRDDERALIPVASGVTAKPGFPTTAELAAQYANQTGASLDRLGFYRALSAMKLAVILEGVHQRFLAGSTVGPGYNQAGAAVPVLVARGLRQLLA